MKTKYLILAWLIWLSITGLVYLGYLNQQELMRDWYPTSIYEVEAPGESFDVIIITWVFVGGASLIALLLGSFGIILYKLKLVKTRLSFWV